MRIVAIYSHTVSRSLSRLSPGIYLYGLQGQSKHASRDVSKLSSGTPLSYPKNPGLYLYL